MILLKKYVEIEIKQSIVKTCLKFLMRNLKFKKKTRLAVFFFIKFINYYLILSINFDYDI